MSDFDSFLQTARAMAGEDVDPVWLKELWDGADGNANRAVNHLLDTPESKFRRTSKPKRSEQKQSEKRSKSTSKRARSGPDPSSMFAPPAGAASWGAPHNPTPTTGAGFLAPEGNSNFAPGTGYSAFPSSGGHSGPAYQHPTPLYNSSFDAQGPSAQGLNPGLPPAFVPSGAAFLDHHGADATYPPRSVSFAEEQEARDPAGMLGIARAAARPGLPLAAGMGASSPAQHTGLSGDAPQHGLASWSQGPHGSSLVEAMETKQNNLQAQLLVQQQMMANMRNIMLLQNFKARRQKTARNEVDASPRGWWAAPEDAGRSWADQDDSVRAAEEGDSVCAAKSRNPFVDPRRGAAARPRTAGLNGGPTTTRSGALPRPARRGAGPSPRANYNKQPRSSPSVSSSKASRQRASKDTTTTSRLQLALDSAAAEQQGRSSYQNLMHQKAARMLADLLGTGLGGGGEAGGMLDLEGGLRRQEQAVGESPTLSRQRSDEIPRPHCQTPQTRFSPKVEVARPVRLEADHQGPLLTPAGLESLQGGEAGSSSQDNLSSVNQMNAEPPTSSGGGVRAYLASLEKRMEQDRDSVELQRAARAAASPRAGEVPLLHPEEPEEPFEPSCLSRPLVSSEEGPAIRELLRLLAVAGGRREQNENLSAKTGFTGTGRGPPPPPRGDGPEASQAMFRNLVEAYLLQQQEPPSYQNNLAPSPDELQERAYEQAWEDYTTERSRSSAPTPAWGPLAQPLETANKLSQATPALTSVETTSRFLAPEVADYYTLLVPKSEILGSPQHQQRSSGAAGGTLPAPAWGVGAAAPGLALVLPRGGPELSNVTHQPHATSHVQRERPATENLYVHYAGMPVGIGSNPPISAPTVLASNPYLPVGTMPAGANVLGGASGPAVPAAQLAAGEGLPLPHSTQFSGYLGGTEGLGRLEDYWTGGEVTAMPALLDPGKMDSPATIGNSMGWGMMQC